MLNPDPRRDTIRFRLAAAAGALTAALLVAAAALLVLVGARRKADREMLRAAQDQAAYGARLILEQTIHFASGSLDLLLFASTQHGRVRALPADSLLERLRWAQTMALMDSSFRDSLRTGFTIDVRSDRTQWAADQQPSDAFREAVRRAAIAKATASPASANFASSSFPWLNDDVTLWLIIARDSAHHATVINGVTYSRGRFFKRYIPHVLATVPILPASVSGGRWDLTNANTELALQQRYVSVRLEDLSNHRVEFDTGVVPREGAWGEYVVSSDSSYGYRARVGLADTLVDVLQESATAGVPEWALWSLIGIAVVLAAIAVMVAQHAFAGLTRRQRFLAAVSHELRTPLTQVRLSVETLRRLPNGGDERRARTVDALDRGTEQLTRTVENLLALAKSELPTWRVRPRPTDFEALVRNAVDTMMPLAATRRVTFEMNVAEPAWAMIDPDAFRQVVLNLLDNAVKYGPREQKVQLRLRCYKDVTELSIADQGPGIPAEARDRIWNAFERLNDERTGQRDGLGLGLSVVRDIVERHNGWIRIAEGIGGGAVFVIGVPSADPADVVPSTAEYPIVDAALRES